MYGQKDGQSAKSLQMAKSVTGNGPEAGAGCSADKSLGTRETRHFMRRIAAEVGADMGDLFKYNQLMVSRDVEFECHSELYIRDLKFGIINVIPLHRYCIDKLVKSVSLNVNVNSGTRLCINVFRLEDLGAPLRILLLGKAKFCKVFFCFYK